MSPISEHYKVQRRFIKRVALLRQLGYTILGAVNSRVDSRLNCVVLWYWLGQVLSNSIWFNLVLKWVIILPSTLSVSLVDTLINSLYPVQLSTPKHYFCVRVIEPWCNLDCAVGVDFSTMRRYKCSLRRTDLSPYLKYFDNVSVKVCLVLLAHLLLIMIIFIHQKGRKTHKNK